jgi:hypothetical protein
MERNTAKLTIEHGGHYGFIYFDKGQIVHAEYDPNIGEEAIFRLLTLYSGNFKVESGIRAPAKTIHTNWNILLLDGLHKLDSQDEGQEKKYEHLFERLLTVKGVQLVYVITPEGEMISRSSDKDLLEGFLHAFIMSEIRKISIVMDKSLPAFISIAATPVKYVIAPYHQLFIVMEMDIKAKFDIILPFIRQALGLKA